MTIAISGKSGCGNSTVTRIVAAKLGLKVVNYTFRNLAVERGVSFSELHKKAMNDPSMDHVIDERQLAAAAAGNCVIGSRLAIWLLSNADLKVYLAGTPEVRAARISTREGIPFSDTLNDMNARDTQDRIRYNKQYKIDIDQYNIADLLIDTSTNDESQVATAIITAANEKTSGMPIIGLQ